MPHVYAIKRRTVCTHTFDAKQKNNEKIGFIHEPESQASDDFSETMHSLYTCIQQTVNQYKIQVPRVLASTVYGQIILLLPQVALRKRGPESTIFRSMYKNILVSSKSWHYCYKAYQ